MYTHRICCLPMYTVYIYQLIHFFCQLRKLSEACRLDRSCRHRVSKIFMWFLKTWGLLGLDILVLGQQPWSTNRPRFVAYMV